MREKTYTTFQIADLCGVYPTTVINWVKKGQLKAFTTPGGHRRVVETDLKEFLEKYQIPVSVHEGGAARILIVDDEKAVSGLLERALRKAAPSLEVRSTGDGINALIEIGQQPPDLVILDIMMPVIDGARVLASLRTDKRTKDIKVLVITGKALPADKLRFIKRHCDGFYKKPFDVKAFVTQALALVKVRPVVPV